MVALKADHLACPKAGQMVGWSAPKRGPQRAAPRVGDSAYLAQQMAKMRVEQMAGW